MKYELTEETKTLDNGRVLHRIRAARDFLTVHGKEVHEGDLGGWIEKEYNLSHDGSAWVYDEANVYGDAKVYGSAEVFGNVRVGGYAKVLDKAKVFGNVRVYGSAWVYDEANVYGDARVFAEANVFGNAKVFGDAKVYGGAQVYGSSEVFGNVFVGGSAELCGDAKVGDNRDYSVYKNTWSSRRWFTYTRSNGKWKVGCFLGTGEELVAKAYKDSELSGRCYEAIVRAHEAIDKAIEEANEAK